jgi:glycosyltransferase involved in cell wall biosynthesis
LTDFVRDSERRARVLVVINRLTELGGAEGSTTLIIEGLQGTIDFAVVTLHGLELRGRDALEDRGTKFFESEPGFRGQFRAVVTAIRDFRPDLLHATLFDAELVSCLAGLLCGVPVVRSLVSTQYGTEAMAAARSPARLRIIQRVDGWLARFATFRFHAISTAVAEAAVESLGVRPERLVTVARGRDAEALGANTPERRHAARVELSVPESAPVLLNVARQDPQKGQLYLLDALRLILKEHAGTVLLVAGRQGSSTPELLARTEALDLGDHVRFLGTRADVPELLCAADLFVFPSLWEGLGGAVLEAMAMGIPVVSFAVPAVEEALGSTGVVVPIRDAPALARAVSDLLNDPSRRAAIAREARRRFDEVFAMPACLEGMRRFYEGAIADTAAEYRDPLSWARLRTGRSRNGDSSRRRT